MAYGAAFGPGPVPPAHPGTPAPQMPPPAPVTPQPGGHPVPYPAPPYPGQPYPAPPYPGLLFVPAAARPRPSSAAVWSLVLGVVGVVTAPLLGGLVPGVLALVLSAAARREILAAGGWLTGGRQLAAGRVLGWIAVWVAVTMVVALVALWLIGWGDAAVSPTYPAGVE